MSNTFFHPRNLCAMLGITLASCSVQPGDGGGGRSPAQAQNQVTSQELLGSSGAIELTPLSGMLPQLDYRARHYLNSDPNQSGVVVISNERGDRWKVSTADISKPTFEAAEFPIKRGERLVVTPSGYMWLFSGNRISRSARAISLNDQPMTSAATEQESSSIQGWTVRAGLEELTGSRINILHVDDRVALTQASDGIYRYSVESGRLERQAVTPPAGKKWEDLEITVAGRGAGELDWWLLGNDVLYYRQNLDQGSWHQHELSWGAASPDRISAATIPVEMGDDTRALALKGPVVVMTSSGFYGHDPSGSFRSSRNFDPNKTYTWADVSALVKDYCAACHAGYLGYEKESDWLRNKDYLKAVVKVENKSHSETMPPRGSAEEQRMTDDERAMLVAWLRSQGARTMSLGGGGSGGGGTVDGPRFFQLGAELEAAIAPGTDARCLSCHNSGRDDMRLQSWWLNPVRNNRTGLNGLQASIATLQGTNPVMPPNNRPAAAEIQRIIGLMNQLDLR